MWLVHLPTVCCPHFHVCACRVGSGESSHKPQHGTDSAPVTIDRASIKPDMIEKARMEVGCKVACRCVDTVGSLM